MAVYYVVAEALTNAAKHAGAATLTVAMEAGPDRISLSIRDDGIGGADTSKGSGLVGLKDRVEALGGHMVITSRAGGGTTLNAEIPTQLD